jgi:hypothetical protein
MDAVILDPERFKWYMEVIGSFAFLELDTRSNLDLVRDLDFIVAADLELGGFGRVGSWSLMFITLLEECWDRRLMLWC